MPTRSAHAEWNGSLPEGGGRMAFGSGAFEGPYSFASRMEEGPGTNPEELIGAAHAGCFSMAFSLALGDAGYTPESIDTQASVQFGPDPSGDGFAITQIGLETRARVPEIDAGEFEQIANAAKAGCPVSKASCAHLYAASSSFFRPRPAL